METNTIRGYKEIMMEEKRLVRIEDGRMIAGVCTGLGRYFGVDTTIIRILFLLLFFFAGGGVLLYLILWVIMPLEPAG